ncbi:MAG: hypothetical protein GXO79_00930 [Chlorobi bacterium]|nr:hypothetical protein [Chlorobiota bacterium]
MKRKLVVWDYSCVFNVYNKITILESSSLNQTINKAYEYKYSSAIDYADGKGIVNVVLLK